jgi:hypothetical protein
VGGRAMGRIFFKKYDSSGRFPDGRIKLDVYFEDSEGNKYVWTPDWERGTRHFFLEAYRIEKLNRPQSAELESFKQIAKEVTSEEEIRSFYMIEGELRRLEEGQLVLGCSLWSDKYYGEYGAGFGPDELFFEEDFELSPEFTAKAVAEAKDLLSWLRYHVGHYGNWTVINGKVFDVEWTKEK